MRKLGRLVADSSKIPLENLILQYKRIMSEMLLIDPLPPSNINVLMHAFGHFSMDLNHQEKSFFLESFEKYREERIPLLVTQNLLKSWIIRF